MTIIINYKTLISFIMNKFNDKKWFYYISFADLPLIIAGSTVLGYFGALIFEWLKNDQISQNF